jgi:hypothetical protein
MPLITDPDLLVDGTELTINTTTKTITLNIAGNLDAAGVTGQALYSKLKELWRTNSTYIKFAFPMESITPEQFEFIQDWEPGNDATRKLLRTCGWAERAAAGTVKRQYAGIITLGSLTGTPYYQQSAVLAKVNFTYLNGGAVNEAVQIFGDVTNGNFDRRTYLKLFTREQAKKYGQSSNTAIGVTTMTYIAYRFPLGNEDDLKITQSDGTIAGNAPYTSIDIEYFAVNQNRNIGGSNYPFRVIIDGANATAEQIYEKVQYLLRQASDIDQGAGTITGNVADGLLSFVGDTLVTGQGVYVDNFNANDTNRITFTDQNGVARIFPFVAAGTLVFNNNLVNDASAVYRMFFATLPGAGNDFGEAGAILVQDKDGVPIQGNVSGQSSLAFTFAYDSNVQGGRTAGTDADVVVVATGLSGAQYVVATATIKRQTGQNISLVSALERNYVNP